MTEEASKHPRPLVRRRKWIDLNGPWEFQTDDADLGVSEGWFADGARFEETIVVPFPPESEASGVARDGHAIVWYRRSVAIEREDGQRVILRFGAVDYRCDVWVNGTHVTQHEGGHIGFAIDITPALLNGAEQSVVVRAFDDPVSLEQPRGKQDWEPEPHVIWYRRTTGIWRTVWAEVVDSTHLDSLVWTPLASPGEVAVEARLALGASDGGMLDLTFELDGKVIALSSHSFVGGRVSATIKLADARFASEPERLLWSPESPTLVDVHAAVRVGSNELDAVDSYVGLRTVGTDARCFLLNERPYFLRLVLEQAYWPATHLASPSEDAIRAEVELIKSLGFNGLRMHQTVADPRFLFWCDRLGLLVWADAPASYEYSTVSLARTTREWLEIVARDASHPSVVAWVAFNESWGVPEVATSGRQQDAVAGLYHLIKSLDPTRPVIGNDGWEFVVGDMLGVHDYTQSSEAITARYSTFDEADRTIANDRPGNRDLVVRAAGIPRVPVVLSEFGGVSFTSAEETWAGYGSVGQEAEFLERLGGLLAAANDSKGLAGFCYTQLTDTMQERNGLLTEDREPKASLDAIAAIVRGL